MTHRLVRLPVGCADAEGRIHSEAHVRALGGREEELLVDRRSGPPAKLVSQVLSCCVERIGEIAPVTVEAARSLSTIDRQVLLFALRALTFGDEVRATVACPAPQCGAKADIDFRVSDIPLAPEAVGQTHSFELSRELAGARHDLAGRAVFRLPNGADQEDLAEIHRGNPAEALTSLLGRCLLSLGERERPSADDLRALPAAARREIERRIAEATPASEVLLDVSCPECTDPYEVSFDIQDFFFGELRISEAVLRREVHYLAYHYHWSESEIMAMPRARRRKYIDVLAEQIERLNDAACSAQ